MKTFIIVLVALLAMVGAASADIISGTGNYQWNGAGYINTGSSNNVAGSGAVTSTSGAQMNLYTAVTNGNPSGTPVGTSSIDNAMTLSITDFPSSLVNPYAATQYGSNTITLNNNQKPGTTDQTNYDFASTSSSGGQVQFASEGIGTGTVGDGAIFSATSTGVESEQNNFLLKPVTVTDTNTLTTANNYITPLAISEGTGTSSTVTIDHTQITVPGGSQDLTIPSLHIKSGEFNWDCSDSSAINMEDCYTKDRVFGSGISASVAALGEASPTVNGLNSATTGMVLNEGGTQHITVSVG